MRSVPGSANFVAKPWQAISVLSLASLSHGTVSNKLTNSDDRLGIKLDPQAVRLQPTPEDGYAWSVTDSKRHLMKTCLSNGTVGLYDEICKEIGQSIEAVRPTRPTGPALGSGPLFGSDEDDSFTATIQRLRLDNHKLREENLCLQDRIEKIYDSSQMWEKQTRHLQTESEREKSLIQELERELSGVRRDVQEAIRLLGRHQTQV
ncbi:hypothetical protein BJX63DRAFT_438789 [Aspergillus granulosus]|uniref:Uncharacterized protein n=1 Tax=Aspergillus granulosus TaxID=176169 RepID=A0ABR4GR11_9EURO